MSPPHQSNRSLNKGKKRKVPGINKILLFVLLVVFALTFNTITLIGTVAPQVRQKSNIRKAEPSYSNLVKLNPKTLPKRTDRWQEWDKWATEDAHYKGIYSYHSDAIIHFPFLDLDSLYQTNLKSLYLQSLGEAESNNGFPPVVKFKDSNVLFHPKSCFMLTRKGFKPNTSANQDRVVVLSQPNHDQHGDVWWMGLFDGHGDFGHVVSNHAALEFPKRLVGISPNMEKELTENLIKDIFMSIDKDLPRSVAGASGSTAISILKNGKYLYLSNTGDSEAFVACYDKDALIVEVIYQTKKHKPDVPEEKARIEAAGGEVELPQFLYDSPRVVIPDPENPMLASALAMSRCLGDLDGKKFGLLSAEPTTDVLDLSLLSKKLNYVVVTATDGVFDKVPLLEVARHVAESMAKGHSNALPRALEEIMLKSSQSWLDERFMDNTDSNFFPYRDDISIAIHGLNIE